LTQNLIHPHIQTFIEAFESKSKIYLVLEKYDKGNLEELIENSTQGIYEHDIANIMGKVLMALNYIHDKGFVHRDIKPVHIIFSNYVPKICNLSLTNCLCSNSVNN